MRPLPARASCIAAADRGRDVRSRHVTGSSRRRRWSSSSGATLAAARARRGRDHAGHRSCPRDRALHRHRRLDARRLGDGRPPLEGAAGGVPRRGPRAAPAIPRNRDRRRRRRLPCLIRWRCARDPLRRRRPGRRAPYRLEVLREYTPGMRAKRWQVSGRLRSNRLAPSPQGGAGESCLENCARPRRTRDNVRRTCVTR